jgi:hypothetical protein
MGVDWTTELADQLDWQWQNHFRPGLEGLTTAEYLWEPVLGMWSVRPGGTSAAPIALGGGEFTFDYARPEPDPVPVTTIAWRLSHLLIGFGQRTASHFGGEPADPESYDYPGEAGTALGRLDAAYSAWISGVKSLDAVGLARPCGPAEGPYADAPMAALVLHINREALHHSAEILVLRDLYRCQLS